MKKNLIVLILIFTILFSKDVNAASVSASANKTSLIVGEEFNVNVNLSGASVSTLTVSMSIDPSKIEYISGPANSNFSGGRVIYTWTDLTGGSNPQTGGTIATFKFRAKEEGTANFSLTGDFYDVDENNINMVLSGTSVTIIEKKQEPVIVEQPPPKNETNNPSTTNNSSTIPNNNTQTNNMQSNFSSNANLKTLQLDVEGISPAFNTNTTEYFLVVDKNIENINVVANAEDTNSSVSISGNQNLNIGSNKIIIEVTARNGSKKMYTINVTKTDDIDSANANLENLAIENAQLKPEFSADITEYFVEVESGVDRLKILAIPHIEGANVTINKPEILSYGKNVIEVKVLAKDGITEKKYIINVDRKNLDFIQENDNENNYKKIIAIVIGIILISIVWISIFFIIKRNNIVKK